MLVALFKLYYASNLRVNTSVDGKNSGMEMSRYVWFLKNKGKELWLELGYIGDESVVSIFVEGD